MRTIVALALSLASSAALADPNVPGLRGILGMEAGNYSFVQYDKTLLQKTYLDAILSRSQADRDYFLAAVKDVEGEFKRLAQENVYGATGLKGMSDRSTKGGNQPVASADFLKAINDYNSARLALDTKINSITSIAGAFPSQVETKADGSGVGNVPTYGNINFAKLTEFYADKLAKIDNFLSNLAYSIQLPSGLPHMIVENSGKGLVLDVPAFQFTTEQIRDMQKKALALRQWDAKAEETANTMTVFVKRLVQKFISTYGVTERYRFHDAAYAKQKEDAARELVTAFWSRSYLRAVYGMPLGAIGIPYAKRMANLDFFTASTKGLAQFNEEPVWEQTEMVQIEQNYRLALNTADARASKILDGSVSLMRRANALITFLGGYSQLADSMKTVLTLMAADFYEEKLIMQPGGTRQMASRYRTRYLITDEDKKFITELESAYDPETAGSSGNDPYGGSGGIASGGLFKYFEDVRLECKTMEYRIAQADQITAEVANATSISGKNVDNRKERRKRLHD
jgi:hypothetical protein